MIVGAKVQQDARDNCEILKEEADHGLLLHPQVLCLYGEESCKPLGDEGFSRSTLASAHPETHGTR